jgi:aryl-alcohol dehydrogenase-like predicted oxidoreductase
MLFHRADGLLDQDGDRRWRSLTHEREAGRVARLGVSVYTPEELAAVRARFPIDIVQLPFSLLDRRFESQISGLAADGVEVHLRSVFLQGVLLTPPGHLPPFLGALGKAHKAFHALLAQARLSPITAALAVALQTPASRAIVGCQSESEFTEIADAAAQLEDLPRELRDRLSDPSWGQPSGLIDPRFWPA